jgi:hypothetical protein
MAESSAAGFCLRRSLTLPQEKETIWQSNGQEAIVVPALYSDFPLSALHLIAFSTNGRVLADTLVTAHVPGGDVSVVCPFPEMCFTGKIPPDLSPPPCLNPSRCLTEVTGWSPPDVAVWQDPRGGTPMIIVSDVYRPFLKGVKSAPLSFNQPTRSSAKGADLPNSSETYNSLVPQRLNRVLGQFNDGMAEADAIAVLGPDCRWRLPAMHGRRSERGRPLVR